MWKYALIALALILYVNQDKKIESQNSNVSSSYSATPEYCPSSQQPDRIKRQQFDEKINAFTQDCSLGLSGLVSDYDAEKSMAENIITATLSGNFNISCAYQAYQLNELCPVFSNYLAR